MLNNTDHPTPGNRSQLDYLTLWLNFETKLDVLRGQFLTIAGLLFTLQAGVFVLMLDKMFDNSRVDGLYLFEIIVAIISVLTYSFLWIITNNFNSHLDNNFYRSEIALEISENTPIDIAELKKDINKRLKEKNKTHVVQDHKRIVQKIRCIYDMLFWFTIVILVIDIIIFAYKNP